MNKTHHAYKFIATHAGRKFNRSSNIKTMAKKKKVAKKKKAAKKSKRR